MYQAALIAAVLAAALAARTHRAARTRDDTGASYILAVLLIAAVTISMAWLAKDTLWDTQDKANDKIKTEVGQFDK